MSHPGIEEPEPAPPSQPYRAPIAIRASVPIAPRPQLVRDVNPAAPLRPAPEATARAVAAAASAQPIRVARGGAQALAAAATRAARPLVTDLERTLGVGEVLSPPSNEPVLPQSSIRAAGTKTSQPNIPQPPAPTRPSLESSILGDLTALNNIRVEIFDFLHPPPPGLTQSQYEQALESGKGITAPTPSQFGGITTAQIQKGATIPTDPDGNYWTVTPTGGSPIYFSSQAAAQAYVTAVQTGPQASYTAKQLQKYAATSAALSFIPIPAPGAGVAASALAGSGEEIASQTGLSRVGSFLLGRGGITASIGAAQGGFYGLEKGGPLGGLEGAAEGAAIGGAAGLAFSGIGSALSRAIFTREFTEQFNFDLIRGFSSSPYFSTGEFAQGITPESLGLAGTETGDIGLAAEQLAGQSAAETSQSEAASQQVYRSYVQNLLGIPGRVQGGIGSAYGSIYDYLNYEPKPEPTPLFSGEYAIGGLTPSTSSGGFGGQLGGRPPLGAYGGRGGLFEPVLEFLPLPPGTEPLEAPASILTLTSQGPASSLSVLRNVAGLSFSSLLSSLSGRSPLSSLSFSLGTGQILGKGQGQQQQVVPQQGQGQGLGLGTFQLSEQVSDLLGVTTEETPFIFFPSATGLLEDLAPRRGRRRTRPTTTRNQLALNIAETFGEAGEELLESDSLLGFSGDSEIFAPRRGRVSKAKSPRRTQRRLGNSVDRMLGLG